MGHFSITGTTKTYPKLPFEAMKNDILGRSYELSLVFVGETRARALNKQTRGKTYTPNVLSFPLTEKSGEIYITPAVAKKEAQRYDHSYKAHVGYLFIHGLLHLKGFAHGPKMERLEQRFLHQYRLA